MTRSWTSVLSQMALAAWICLFATVAVSFDLTWPDGAELRAEHISAPLPHTLPVGVFTGQTVPTEVVVGVRRTRAWSVQSTRPTDTFALFDDVRGQIVDAGFEILLDCATEACGGFDFRRRFDLVPPPEMFLDLGEFYVLTAKRLDQPGGDVEMLMVVISQAVRRVTAQVSLVSSSAPPELSLDQPTLENPGDTGSQATVPSTPLPRPEGDLPQVSEAAEATETIATRLRTQGRVILSDIVFAAGAADLDNPRSLELSALADTLKADPTLRIVIVGHTDATGAASANLALSKARARAVERSLIEVLGVSPSQLSHDGVGFLVPRESNATEEGRATNRRVEVVLLPN